MKKYNSQLYARVDYALNDCNNHQDRNVINIYPTGWRHEVCVVYYTCTDALKQKWKPSDEQMNALSVSVKHGQTDNPDALKKLLEQLKKLKEE